MACQALHTGSKFLSGSLVSLDCHGRSIGSYGFGALADPHSVAAAVVNGLLALFIALWGIRLLAGHQPGPRDLVSGAIKVGLFLTLATSWPAWRVIGYDLVLDGPAQIARTVGVAAGLPGSANDLADRLQDADNAIVTLTMYGSGRLSGAINRNTDLGDSTMGVALPDQSTLGTARSVFLISTIGTYALARLGAGLLLAVAPIMAGLLLFSGTSPVFTGWLRALGFCSAASLVFQIAVGAELSMLYPWIGEVLQFRQGNVLTASAPTELLVLAGSFALAMAGSLVLLGAMMFMPGFSGWTSILQRVGRVIPSQSGQAALPAALSPPQSNDRATVIVDALENTVRRENPAQTLQMASGNERAARGLSPTDGVPVYTYNAGSRQGDRFRRTNLRTSQASRRRDSK